MITKVLKFGGSSVADAKNINKVIDIILQSRQKEENIVVVVSAFGGVTDDLLRLATFASKKDQSYKVLFIDICQRHNQVVKELINAEDVGAVLLEVNKKYNELDETLKYIIQTELYPSSLDAVMSLGEQLSAYIISEAIKNRGTACTFVDSRMVIKTDSNFGEANVDIENSYKVLLSYFKDAVGLLVMGGFIASNKNGVTTTLGRGGSDYTAALVGAALGTASIEIWTDVDGLMTADPKKVEDAATIAEITYDKAEKMALAGAKVIHPKTMKPARLKNIPIYIKNTFNPKGAGTKISNDK